MISRPSLGIWKVVGRQQGDQLRFMITRNGVDVLDEPMIFKGQAVSLKGRMCRAEQANVREATLASYGDRR
jgi:hypothetical protein